MEIKQSTAFAAPVKLRLSTTGAGQTGLAYTDVTVYTQKQGALGAVSKSLAAAEEFLEVNATHFAGVYDLTLSSSDTDTLGFIKYSVEAANCETYHGILEVVANVEADTYARLGAPAGASISADIAAAPDAVWGSARDATLKSLSIVNNTTSPALLIQNTDAVSGMAVGIESVAGVALKALSSGNTAVELNSAGGNALYATSTGSAMYLESSLSEALSLNGSTPLDAATVAQIAGGVLDEAVASHLGVGSLGEAVNDINTNVAGIVSTNPTAEEISDAVWDESLGAHSGVLGSTAEAISVIAGNVPPTVAAIVDGVWDDDLANRVVSGSAGEALVLMRGLSQHNYILDQTVFNSEGLMTSARIRIFPTEADTEAETNVLATMTVTGTAKAAPNEAQGDILKVTRTS